MVASTKHIKLRSGSDLARLLREAASEPTIIEADGERFRIVRDDSLDIFANYDPERALAALRDAFGTLPSEGIEELKRDLREMRDQHSTGRPVW